MAAPLIELKKRLPRDADVRPRRTPVHVTHQRREYAFRNGLGAVVHEGDGESATVAVTLRSRDGWLHTGQRFHCMDSVKVEEVLLNIERTRVQENG